MVSVQPINTKQPIDVINAMVEVFKILGIPNQICSDLEGAFNDVGFFRLRNKHKIKHIMTVGSAHFVENYNRQFKEKNTNKIKRNGIKQR